MLSEYFILALKNLSHRGLRSWLTLLGIIIGIAAVISFISLGNSLEQAITGQFSSLGGDRLVVSNVEAGFGPPGSTVVKKLNSHDKKLIEEVNGVKSIIVRIIRPAKIEFNKEIHFTFLGSLPDKQEDIDYIYEIFQIEPNLGSLIKERDTGVIILGSDYSKDNIFGKHISINDRIKIQDEEFKVSGILKPLSSPQFNGAIFMSEEDMRSLLKIRDESDLFIVKIEEPKRIEKTAEAIKKSMRKDRGLKEGEEDFSVETPLQTLEAVNTILSVIKLVIAGIAAISLLIGAIGVANTMFTSVIERTKEIGVMKAIGAKNKNIFIIFLIESSFLGFLGGVLGALLGLAMAFLASQGANSALGASSFKISFNIPLMLGAILFSLFLGILAGVIPAIQASKLHPVEALRK